VVSCEFAVVSVLWVEIGRGIGFTGAHVVNMAALLHERKASKVCQTKISTTDVGLDEYIGRFAGESGCVQIDDPLNDIGENE